MPDPRGIAAGHNYGIELMNGELQTMTPFAAHPGCSTDTRLIVVNVETKIHSGGVCLQQPAATTSDLDAVDSS